MPEIKVGVLADFPENKLCLAKADNEEIMVVNVGGKLYGIGNRCTHTKCPLNRGKLEGEIVTCPCHGSKFNVTSGQVTNLPALESVLAYDVIVKGQDVFVKLPGVMRGGPLGI